MVRPCAMCRLGRNRLGRNRLGRSRLGRNGRAQRAAVSAC
jgi:hypothetical protein